MGYKYLNAVLLSDKPRVKLVTYDLQLTTYNTFQTNSYQHTYYTIIPFIG